MGTIPLYWGEEAAFGDALSGNAAPHWARAQLEAGYTLAPARHARATDEPRRARLPAARAAARAERGRRTSRSTPGCARGGRLLLFADPLLTGESRFAIGDRRRPQDVILLSPILGALGPAARVRRRAAPRASRSSAATARIPVNLPGSFVSDGRLRGRARTALLARCAIGEGRVLAVADAALLDLYEPHPAAPAALDWLVEQGFGSGTARESAAERVSGSTRIQAICRRTERRRLDSRDATTVISKKIHSLPATSRNFPFSPATPRDR